MPQGLNPSRVVSVSISLTALLAGYSNFGRKLIVGSTPGVIDVAERKRDYDDIDGVGQDFGTVAPEFLAAEVHFSQVPRPATLSISRWAQAATHGLLKGAILTPAQRLVTLFTPIINGGLTVPVDGTAHVLASLNFSGATNLNGVASTLQAALVTSGATGATVLWDGVRYRFVITSGTTGATSILSYATPAAGTDVSVLLGLSATNNATGANADPPVAGVASETALAAAQAIGEMFGDWYAMSFAPVAPLADSDALTVASYIEATGNRIVDFTTQNTKVLDSTRSDDLASLLMTSGFNRSFIQFSSGNPYAADSIFARFATVNYTGSNTTITGKFKQEPGIAPETLTADEADTIRAKNCNVYAAYRNGTAIVQEAVMASGIFIDQRINADWLADYIQVNTYNVLLAQPKVPQTDKGMGILAAAMAASCQQAVANGYAAEGQWNGPPIGGLDTGDVVPGGFYIYVPKVASQAEADRQARKSVLFQIALKEAGAVHSADILIDVNP